MDPHRPPAALADRVEDIYALSAIQRGILFESLTSGDRAAYSIGLRCRVHGALDLAAFEAALQGLVDRHPILRTSFQWEGLREPVQIVHRRVAARLIVADGRQGRPSDRDARLAADRQSIGREPFALDRPSLLRAYVARLTNDECALALSFHHLILDGWSLALLLRELFLRYELARRGANPEPVLPPPRPYKDFVRWSREPADAALQFWRDRLANVTTTPLPFARAVGAIDPAPAVVRRMPLAPRTRAAIEELARHHQLTVSTIVLGVWTLLVGRLTQARDVVVGTSVSGRSPQIAGIEEMIGVFINTVPVRASIDPRAPALAWLERFHRSWLECAAHESCPLAEIQRASGLPAGTPLFDSLVLYQNYPRPAALAEALERTGLRLTDIEDLETTNDALRVEAIPGPELQLSLTYRPERLEAGADRLLDYFTTLLEGIVRDPNRPIGWLSLVTESERAVLVSDGAASSEPLPAESVCELIERQVAEGPDRIAVTDARTSLTYGELAARVDRDAARLLSHGVYPGALVAVLADRDCDLAALLIAILKVGAAYLPLDPAHAPARHARALDVGEPDLLLVRDESRASLERESPRGPFARTRRISLAEFRHPPDPAAPAACGVWRPPSRHLAYVIFTSGSTGRAKGAMIEHEGMMNHLCAKIRDLGLSAADRIAQSASQSFDISIWQLLAPLLVGAESVICDDATCRDAARLAAAIDRHGITVLEAVPTMIKLLLDQVPESAAAPSLFSLRWLIASGEELPPDVCRQWLRRHRTAPIVNAYGATECSDDFTQHVLRDEAAIVGSHVPVGRTIANMSMFVLDANGELLPCGIPGELYASGIALGRGYCRDAATTAVTFVPDPLTGRAGGRLYRTRDRARRLPDGSVEFLGRLDGHVKLRGFFVDLTEVATVLRRQPGVRDAVALVREDVPGDRRLVAYVVAEPAAPIVPATLRRLLRRQLPEYMVPSAVVAVPAIPLDPNGKTDRRALPPPALDDAIEREPFVGLTTPTEIAVAAVWSELLGVTDLGTRDDFFQLGGDSIRATQLVARLRSRLGVELPLAVVFERPVLTDLAVAIDQTVQAASVAAIRPVPRQLQQVPVSGI